MSSNVITLKGGAAFPDSPTAFDYKHQDGQIIYRQEEVIETTIDLDRLTRFQEKKEKILSSNKLYYPISRRICLLLIILGITGVVSFIAGLHDILVLPILLLIGGVGMKRTVDLAAMERAKNNEKRD